MATQFPKWYEAWEHGEEEKLQQQRKEMMNAETEDKVLELSVERLYQSLKESIKL